ncbi:bile acid:sodium symporter family protein [Microvirga sp. 2TAF3]|uniref:bile acid:sodium symporter family protein n=1 Tax=Microvirga sp. 2TAF3 TaxID=3233014 RepID=UPI003F9A2EA6
MASFSYLKPDRFTLALVATVGLASIVPATGTAVPILNATTIGSIALLFFLQGARLPREAIIGGLVHWRLHLTVLAATFVLFPLLGFLLSAGLKPILPSGIVLGILFLCFLPSTIQSSITFTSIARGNVAAAVCSASASNFLGVFLTPLLLSLFMNLHGQVSLSAVGSIAGQLLVPFVAGHLARPWIGDWVKRHHILTSLVDRGTILLVVYFAFGEAVVSGLWHQLAAHDLIVLVIFNCVLLAAVLMITTYTSRMLGFSREDEIAIVFCGSKKSLGSGVPIASILFPAAAVGAIILPLMLFHQIQLMVCAVLARNYANRSRV